MKRITFLLFAFLAVPPSFAQDGPFGISMGDAPEQHGCDQNNSQTEDFYTCTDIAKPHPDFEDYYIWAKKETGIAIITAAGKVIENDQFGRYVRHSIDKIVNQLSNKYGKYYLHVDDLVNSNSIWTGVDEWGMSIYQQDRHYYYDWKFDPPEEDDGIAIIEVSAVAMSGDKTFMKILFRFSNAEELDRINNEEGADVF